jgi:hypothetical protein
MTRAQWADALLAMAGRWQVGRAAGEIDFGVDVDWLRIEIWDWMADGKGDTQIPDLLSTRGAAASLANSEVSHKDIGFDIDGAEVWDRAKKVWRKT